MMKKMRVNFKFCLWLVLAAVFVLGLSNESSANEAPVAPGIALAKQAKPEEKGSTVDHSKLKQLDKNFKSGDEITKACLECHTEADHQFKKTYHWTWKDPKSEGGKGADSVNNFCISANNMEDPLCIKCHPGWNGKKGEVNCLSCHGQEKFDFAEAFKDIQDVSAVGDKESIEIVKGIQDDVKKAAQDVGAVRRRNCGDCHFKGGGGDGVKHGDLDTSLLKPSRELDVHMGIDGENFDCTRCHTTTSHNIAGRFYGTPAEGRHKSLMDDDQISRISCESCHSATPHKPGVKANDHTDKVACQSCHIPTFARELPTKMYWDWSASGKLKDGKYYSEEGPYGKHTYDTKKGDFVWGKDVVPEYYWYNGTMTDTTVNDIIDPSKPVKLRWPIGTPNAKDSRIFPFKVHVGKQPYDLKGKNFLAPLVSGPKDYWKTLDWEDAFTRGMATLGKTWSGEYGFVDTKYAFPTTHMVVPGENALSCTECHTPANGRLANIEGVYIPGRDRLGYLGYLGWFIILASLAGVLIHAAIRIASSKRRD